MTERLIGVDIKNKIVESITRLEGVKPKMSDVAMEQKKDLKYEGKIEGMLSGVLTRIIFAKNFQTLGFILEETAKEVRVGNLGARELDQVKARVIDVANELGELEDEGLATTLEALFKRGKYEEAALTLKQQVNGSGSGFNQTEKQELGQFLDRIRNKGTMTEDQLEKLSEKLSETYMTEVHEKTQGFVNEMYGKTEKLQLLIAREAVKVLTANKNVLPPEVDMQVKISASKRGAQGSIWKEVQGIPAMEIRDQRFIRNLVGKASRFGATESGGTSGERRWDFQKMVPEDVGLVWSRTGEILAKYKNELAKSPETKELLDKMYDGARERMLNVSEDRGTRKIGENVPDEGLSPQKLARIRAKLPPQEELDFFADRRYRLNDEGAMGVDSILRLQRDRMLENGVGDPDAVIRGKTAGALESLKEKNSIAKKFLDYDRKSGKWAWGGSKEEYFDLCREQIYEIQGTLTQENMSQLVFEESAQTYLALMRVDVGEKMELENAKDAITKMLYIDYAVKNMWKSGANVETWQRIAGLMTREREEGFFEIMNIGENLKVTDKDGNKHNFGRFTADDIMSLREMKADDTDRTWKVELGSQSSARKMDKMKGFTRALAQRVVDKRELMFLAGDHKNGLSPQQAQAERVKIKNNEYSFDEKQKRWIMRYGDFLGGATLRDGEHGINQSKVKGKMEMVDHPLGEFAIKTGPWAVIYYYHYGVTKYGGDAVGSLFLPNVSMLSYARGETIGHFFKKDSNVEAGMMTPSGDYKETGTGAKEFFFDGLHEKEAAQFAKFWGDVIFDTDTGSITKTAIHRTVDNMRKKGRERLNEWDGDGEMGFVEKLNFENMELMLGKSMGIDKKYQFKIPGGTKREKFEWMVDNFDYTFWRKDIMKAKREGDWVNKYVAQKYVETYGLLADFLNSPGLATRVAVREKISEYAGDDGRQEWEKDSQDFIDHNNKVWLKGPKTAPGDPREAKWIEGEGGSFYGVERERHSPFEGAHPGSGLAFSIQQLKEGFRNPMSFEKTDLNSAFHYGMISREEWGKRKWKWLAKAYLGQEYSIGKLKFRLGYIPFLTPFFLARGYWVDKLGLDWASFKLAFRKNNEEFTEKLKKMFGIE